MSFILNIDTSTEIASICLAGNGIPMCSEQNANQSDHAAWVHEAIKRVVAKCDLELSLLNAIAVTSGPGSYTGLRVGLATAKGICYALNIPLITESSLVMLAAGMKSMLLPQIDGSILFCPMIDARRMEVFTAIFSPDLEEVMSSQPLILQEGTFDEHLRDNTIIFGGNGSVKFKPMCRSTKAIFSNATMSSDFLAPLSYAKFINNEFDDVAYSQPRYLKEFYTPAKK